LFLKELFSGHPKDGLKSAKPYGTLPHGRAIGLLCCAFLLQRLSVQIETNGSAGATGTNLIAST
jgi:hypothetical protein